MTAAAKARLSLNLRYLTTGIFCAALTLIGIVIATDPFDLALEERVGLAALMHLRGPRQPPAEVLIVGIDALSTQRAGWPARPDLWPRERHADLLERLHAACARVIVFDLYFRDPRAGDAALAAAIAKAGNVVLVSHLGLAKERPAPPIPTRQLTTVYLPAPLLAEAAAGTGAFPLPNRSEGVTGFWTFKADAGDLPSLPTVALHAFLRDTVAHAATGVNGKDSLPRRADDQARALRSALSTQAKVGDGAIHPATRPDDAGIETPILDVDRGESWRYFNFYGPPGSVPTIPYPTALEMLRNNPGCGSTQPFVGKAVFIGYAERDPVEQKDRDAFDTVFSQPDGLKLSGVELAATAFANLLTQTTVRPLPTLWTLIVCLATGILASFLWLGLSARVALGLSVALTAAYGYSAWRLFSQQCGWLPLLAPMTQLWVGGALVTLVQRWRLERQLGTLRRDLAQWLPANAVAEVLGTGRDASHRNELLYGTCLQTELDDFERFAEQLSPAQLGADMADYFATLSHSVTRQHGWLGAQSQDAMLAVWAAADPNLDLRRAACLAALDMHSQLLRIGPQTGAATHPPRTRIGLHTGELLRRSARLGTFVQQQNFGAIVANARRLCEANRLLGTRILASMYTVEGLQGLLLRPVGSLYTPNNPIPIVLFELRGLADGGSAANLEAEIFLRTQFTAALTHYRQREWAQCQIVLGRILAAFPDDGPASYYWKQCELLKLYPPIGTWDPAIRMLG